ncbi:hypothetical protein [Streptomyces sp. NPDC095817]|uniref:hypothetical protein n=3 Tax=Streptomyces TaxID=1883 RepID=UPI003319EFBE
MPGSGNSSDSDHSNASSYHSIRVRSSGTVERSRSAVPESAPELFAGATGMYDQSARQFYAVDTQQQVAARWSSSNKAWEWMKSNKAKLAKALVDVAPTLIQGASTFIPGRAGTIVNGVGIAAQGAVAGQELYGQFQQHRAGGVVDGVQVGASIGRLVSTGLNTYGAVGDQESSTTKMIGGAGSWVAGAATATDLTHHAHTNQGDLAPGDAENQMYGLHNNPQLGNQPGQFPPGYNPPTQPPSSTSSFQTQNPTNASAGTFNPPANARRGQPEGSQEAHRRQVREGKKKVVQSNARGSG